MHCLNLLYFKPMIGKRHAKNKELLVIDYENEREILNLMKLIPSFIFAHYQQN